MNSLWIVFTVIAAAAQTVRNAIQRDLTAGLGAGGAAHIRFLFALPFALLFLAGLMATDPAPLPAVTPVFGLWILLGAITQIGATLLMVMTMEERSFVISMAYLKTEPVIVALLGLIFLGDRLTFMMAAAIVIATIGVVLISLRPGTPRAADGRSGGLRPALLGLGSGALFAFSAIGFRGAILSLHRPDFLMAATFSLAVGLFVQAGLLLVYLALRRPETLRAIARRWRPSLLAGFVGAIASEFWFLAFALATAASVRTLGLVDVLFAQGVTHLVFRQKTTPRELIGIAVLVAGALLLVWAQP
jgi:drug/metabolite transporter (DMT)-like permease